MNRWVSERSTVDHPAGTARPKDKRPEFWDHIPSRWHLRMLGNLCTNSELQGAWDYWCFWGFLCRAELQRLILLISEVSRLDWQVQPGLASQAYNVVTRDPGLEGPTLGKAQLPLSWNVHFRTKCPTISFSSEPCKWCSWSYSSMSIKGLILFVLWA